MAKGIININYKIIIEALIKVYFKVTVKKNAIFIRSRIISSLGILQIDKKRYIISFAKVHKILGIKRSLQSIFKASQFNIKGQKILKVKLIRLNSFLQIQKLKIIITLQITLTNTLQSLVRQIVYKLLQSLTPNLYSILLQSQIFLIS